MRRQFANCPYLFSSHELLQALYLASAPEHDECVAGVQTIIRRERGVEVTFRGAEGEDYGAGPLPDLELTDGALGDGRVLGNGELFQAELDSFLATRDDVQKVDDQRVIGAERHLREGRVTTLPAELPTAADKPLTLLVGSCFYGPEDPGGMVGGAYRYMPEDQRPDVKILCGDQVYLDNPWRETTLKWYRANQKPGLFRAMLFEKYVANWTQVGGEDAGFQQLLAEGANYFCSDDHEFWNNAPNFGGVGLLNSLTSGQRKWWFEEASRLFRAFQSPSPLLRFEVPPLSVCIADTRINRDTKGLRFMRDEDLESLGRWIEGLEGPGILVVGQPVLVEGDGVAKSLLKKGLKNALLSYIDRDLPHYAQYKDLVGHIKSSDHSVVILTGDVHFGRVACGELKPGSETTFVEIISSPRHAVLGDKDEPLFGSYKNAPTNHFPITEDQEVLRRRNHFITVGFLLGKDGRVNMEVRAWPIPRPGEADWPGCDVVFEKVLS